MSSLWSRIADRVRIHLGALRESADEVDDPVPFGEDVYLGNHDFGAEEDLSADDEDFWAEHEEEDDPRRLIPPDRLRDPAQHPEASPPPGTEWVRGIRDLVEQPVLFPEPIRGSRVRIQFLLDEGPESALELLAEYLSAEDVQGLLMSESDRFMVLIEALSMFRAESLRALRSLTGLFGREFVRSLLLTRIDRFLVEGAHLISPLDMFPGLPHAMAFAGPRLNEILTRAAKRDLQKHGKSLLAHRARQFEERYRLFARHGPAATRMAEILGPEFVKRHLLASPGRDIASELIDLGTPIWEDFLRILIGVESFRRRVVEDPDGLAAEFRNAYRMPHSEELRALLGPDRVERLLSSGPKGTLRLCVLGFLAGLRGRRPDDPLVFADLPWEFGKLLASAARHPLVKEALPALGREDDAIERLIGIAVKLESLGVPAVRDTILPVLRSPDDEGSITSGYLAITKRLGDLSSVDVSDLEELDAISTGGRWVFHSLLRTIGVRVGRRQFSALLERVGDLHAGGMRMPPLPDWAEAFQLDVEEIASTRGEADDDLVQAAQGEMLGIASRDDITREWWSTFDLARSLGLRLPPSVIASFRRAAREHRTMKIAQIGFPPLCEFLVAGHNRELAERVFRLALGNLILGDAGLLTRLRSADPAEVTEAILELLAERFPNERGPAVDGLATALAGDFVTPLPSVVTFAAIEEALGAGHPSLGISPLQTKSYRRLRLTVEKELARSRTVKTGRVREIRFTPMRGLVSAFAGLHGEDCSTTTYHARRIFCPGHVFHVIQCAGERQFLGYLLSVPVRMGAGTALHIDVLNPANSLSVDPEKLLRGVFDLLSTQAERGGFSALLAPRYDPGVSNRSRIQNAAESVLRDAPIVGDLHTLAGKDGFQVPSSEARVVWAREGTGPPST